MPGPPPPPPAITKIPPKTKGRANLLSSIEGFKKGKLKTTKTVDKSSPIVSSKISSTISANSNVSNNNSSSNTSQAPMGMALGGLFAGGMPTLRKTGRPGAATMLNSQNTKPKTEVNNTVKPEEKIIKKETKIVEKQEEEHKPLPVPPSKPKELQTTTPIPPNKPKELQINTPIIEEKVTQVLETKSVPIVKPIEPNDTISTQSISKTQSVLPPVSSKSTITPLKRSESNYQTPVTLQRPNTQNQLNSSNSVLPKISYKIDIDMDNIEEHPSIPRYHNPLVASISQKTIKPQKQETLVIDNIPEEEPLPEQISFETDITDNTVMDNTMDDVIIEDSFTVETLSLDDSDYQPKAACELQPKRKELLIASRLGDIDSVMNILQNEPTQMRRKELLNGLDFDEETKQRTSPLHMAIEYGHLALVGTLLSQGANSLLEDSMGNTAIHTVCKSQNVSTMEIFSLLMNSSCNIKAQNQAGNTPLHLACMTNDDKTSLYPQMIYTLVTNPFVDLLIQNSQGFTALMYASQSGDLGVVKLMLTRLSNKDTIKLLNITGTMLSQNGPKKVNAVSLASDRGDVGNITKLLMEYGAEPSPDNFLQTSLGTLLCKLTVTPILYPSNRLARILYSENISKHACDEDAIVCLECNVRFGVMTRRHHCRSCGMIFCSKCSSNQQPLPNTTKALRVCNVCCKFITWYSPIQLVSCRYFIEREALIYRSELEQFNDESVSYVIDRFDNEENLLQIPLCLAEPSWNVKINTKTFKLDDAFTVSKLPTGQGHLPDESYCSLFEFAALYERIKIISEYCLDVYDMLDQQDISLDDSSSGVSITIGQQKASIFILLVVGAQLYSLISRLSESASIFKFLDSSYYKVRAMLQFICELKACSDKEPLNFSHDILDNYAVSNINQSKTIEKSNEKDKLVVSHVDIEPLPDIIEEPLPSIITEEEESVEKPGLFSKLFTKKDESTSEITKEDNNTLSSKLVVADIDIEPLPELDISEEEPIIEEPKQGIFSKLFSKKDSSQDLFSDTIDNNDDDIVPPPPNNNAPPPPSEDIIEEPKQGLFSKLFSKKDTQDDVNDEETTNIDDNNEEEEEPKVGLFSKLFKKKDSVQELDNSSENIDELLSADDVKDDEPVEKPGLFSKLFSKKDSQEALETSEEQPISEDNTSEEPKQGLFSKLFNKKDTQDDVNDEETTSKDNNEEDEEPKVGLFSKIFKKKDNDEISETDKSKEEESNEKTDDKPNESQSRFSWFKRKSVIPEEVPNSVPFVPAPSPSLDLEDDDIPIPVSKNSSTVSQKEQSQKEESIKEAKKEDSKEENIQEDNPNTVNIMNEMKSKLSNIPLVPPVKMVSSVKQQPTNDPLSNKALPTPPIKSNLKPEPKIIKKPEPVEEKIVLPKVQNNLFVDDDSDDDFLSNKKPEINKKESQNSSNDTLSSNDKIEEKKAVQDTNTNKPSILFGNDTPSNLFGDNDSDDDLFTTPTSNKNIEKPKSMEDSLFGVEDDFNSSNTTSIDKVVSNETKENELENNDEDDFFKLKPDNSTENIQEEPVKEESIKEESINEEPIKEEEKPKIDTEIKETPKLEEKPKSIDSSLFGFEDDFEIPIKKPIKSTKKEEKKDTTSSLFDDSSIKNTSNTLFGVEDDFGSSKSSSLFDDNNSSSLFDDNKSSSLFDVSNDIASKKKPIEKRKSSLFTLPEEEENELFASKSPVKQTTTKSKRATTLFDDTEDLFGF